MVGSKRPAPTGGLGTCPHALGTVPPSGLTRATSESGPWSGAPAKVTLQSLLGVLESNFMMTANRIS